MHIEFLYRMLQTFLSLTSTRVLFLIQHQTECHDPLAAVRKERGEKIFACHLVSCTRLFSTPKTRRLHLIQAHGYPKEYFFAVTNKGVGGLLKKWGEGVSLIRGEWKARGTKSDGDDHLADDDSADMDGHSADHSEHGDLRGSGQASTETHRQTAPSDALDDLANTMGSLTLVPPSIRFGRGGMKGGFLHKIPNPERGHNGAVSHDGGYRGRARSGRGRGHGVPHHAATEMDVDRPAVAPVVQPLGRAGRGRAGIIHHAKR
ncbi:hypothetical protein H0H87_007317 [Tephrocybe sp. NHM501043]|nr:hypothetical protein H0H87_007317 [Tephrocybe sp. NHM501043]